MYTWGCDTTIKDSILLLLCYILQQYKYKVQTQEIEQSTVLNCLFFSSFVSYCCKNRLDSRISSRGTVAVVVFEVQQ